MNQLQPNLEFIMSSLKSTSSYHHLLALISAILWGLNFVVAKEALQYFEPFTLLMLRFVIVALVIFPFFPKPPLPLKQLAAISFSFAILHLGMMFWSLAIGLDASVGVLALQMHVPFLLVMGVWFFNEKIGWRSLVGVFLAITGSMILMKTPNSIEHPFAFWLMIGSALAVATYSAQVKNIKHVNPIALIGWVAIFSIPMMLPFAWFFETNHIEMMLSANWNAFLSLLYIAIANAIIAHSLWAYLLFRHPVHKIAPVTLLVPLIGVYAGVFFLGEAISLNMIIGAILMIIGVGIIILRRPKIVQIE